MRKHLAVIALTAAASAGVTGTAQAERNPACPSGVTQIGSTAYVKNYDTTVASVKQFKGCDSNWSYIYVWDQWLSGHRNDFYLITYVSTEPNLTHGYKTGERGQRELWSRAADTLDQCTRAVGRINGDSYFLSAKTSERC
ncbi:hypothetical protein [Nocardia sp. NRRL S-836]|uniref:hypothetical protein n=1 Tax=Nocardia sp. NRRL S-836 TaxID=1519492 RepID=UPI0006AF9C32|nr:hypothetical protein [Nocardia sp. NRRL S-836]